MVLRQTKINQRSYYDLPNSAFWGCLSVESEPQNPEFRKNPKNFHPCKALEHYCCTGWTLTHCLQLFVFFQNQHFLKLLSWIPSEYQAVWTQIRPDTLLGLIWVQTVCKGYQQTTLVGKELTNKTHCKLWFWWSFYTLFSSSVNFLSSSACLKNSSKDATE